MTSDTWTDNVDPAYGRVFYVMGNYNERDEADRGNPVAVNNAEQMRKWMTRYGLSTIVGRTLVGSKLVSTTFLCQEGVMPGTYPRLFDTMVVEYRQADDRLVVDEGYASRTGRTGYHRAAMDKHMAVVGELVVRESAGMHTDVMSNPAKVRVYHITALMRDYHRVWGLSTVASDDTHRAYVKLMKSCLRMTCPGMFALSEEKNLQRRVLTL